MHKDAAERMRDWGAKTAIVLGSGLASLVRDDAIRDEIPYSKFVEVPITSVPGHVGRFVFIEIDGQPIIFAQGRAHLYEGHSGRDVTGGIRGVAAAGVTRVILTNAAGSANENFAPGFWMMIADQLNLTGQTPLLGTAQFVDMTEPFSKPWRAKFASAAHDRKMTLHEGVYAGVLGPQYETAAEVRMLRGLGADAIGMSTVLEVIQARALGMEVAAFSCLTNWAAGIGSGGLSHDEVLKTGKSAAVAFGDLLAATLSAEHAS